jgi:hypothetical protein
MNEIKRRGEEEAEISFHRTLPSNNTDEQLLANLSDSELQGLFYLLPEDWIESNGGSRYYTMVSTVMGPGKGRSFALHRLD